MNMKIEDLLGTRERIAIMNKILYIEELFGVSQISKELKLSKGLTSKYFNILVRNKIIRRSGRKFAPIKSPKLSVLKILLTINSIVNDLMRIFRKYPFVISAGIYGSAARGLNTENSDIDLWMKTRKCKESEKAGLFSEIKSLSNKISPLLIDENGLADLKKKDPLFYYSLHFCTIKIYGEENENI